MDISPLSGIGFQDQNIILILSHTHSHGIFGDNGPCFYIYGTQIQRRFSYKETASLHFFACPVIIPDSFRQINHPFPCALFYHRRNQHPVPQHKFVIPVFDIFIPVIFQNQRAHHGNARLFCFPHQIVEIRKQLIAQADILLADGKDFPAKLPGFLHPASQRTVISE